LSRNHLKRPSYYAGDHRAPPGAGCALEDAIAEVKKNTRRLAKGQRTWFKTFKGVRWIDVGPEETAESVIERAKRELDR
jgi:tRNA A37 N6-isopentenylltransferase MiaA